MPIGAFTTTPAPAASVVTVEQAKAFLRIPAADTSNDTKLALDVAAAVNVCADLVGPITATSVTELRDGGWPTVVLAHRDVLSIGQVVETLGVVSYTLTEQPLGAAGQGVYGYTWDRTTNTLTRRYSGLAAPFLPGKGNVRVDYTAGMDPVPAHVLLAIEELVRHWWQWGQQGNRPAFGGGTDDTPAAGMGYAVPNRVVELLKPSERIPGMA